MSTTHLRSILSSETNRIVGLCRFWQDTLENSDGIPEEIAGRIRAQLGLSKLLVNDKFQQFVRLLDTFDCGNPDVPQRMTMSDLEGFWDLIYIQVEDSIKKFDALSALQQNAWKEVDEQAIKRRKRHPLKSISNKKSPSTHCNDLTEKARKRLAEAKLRIKQNYGSNSQYIDENISTARDTI